MNKLKLHTSDFTDENIKRIAELFPNCVIEDRDDKGSVKKSIDFDLLRQELSKNIVEGPQERYQLSWPGKREALLSANAPIAKTLRPCQEESVDFDTTQNLFIEGDNLDALKLMQETYLGKIKMIYIDPPYKTGNDFIYEDDFAENTEEFLKKSNQKDEEGNRLVANPESNGRFHSDWLSMMYTRLKLARNLLKDDGVIFISIDDSEVHNLRKICDEIFGEQNFVAVLIWQKKTGASDAVTISTITEYILVYSKNILSANNLFTKNSESYDISRYKNKDEHFESRGPYYTDNLDRGGLQYSDSLNFGIECPDGTIAFPNGRTQFKNDGWIWKWSKNKIEWAKKNNFIEFKKTNNKKCGWAVYYKNYLKVDNENGPIKRAAPHKNLITSILNASSSTDIKRLFDERVFQYPKPVDLIKHLIKLVRYESGDIFMDFFSGSATTAHATMQLNSEDNGNRKFIMVQLYEPCDGKSEAYKAGFKNIADIGKERIRRAGQKINRELTQMNSNNENKGSDVFKGDNSCSSTSIRGLDIGFRVLKVDSSNMQDVYYNPDAYSQDTLFKMADNIKPDRTDEDLLFQVLLDWGVDLSLSIVKEKISGNDVFFVSKNALAACFTRKGEITEDFCKELAKREPLRVVFRDSGFKDDSMKINVEQIFKLMSPHTEVKTI